MFPLVTTEKVTHVERKIPLAMGTRKEGKQKKGTQTFLQKENTNTYIIIH